MEAGHNLLPTLGDVSVGRSRCMQHGVVNTYATGVPVPKLSMLSPPLA